MDNKKVINEIKNFLDGSNDDLKYLVHVETDRKNNKATCFIQEPNQEPKEIEVRYTPFLYVKDLKAHNRALYNGDKDFAIRMMKKYGISMKRMKTGNHPRLENGYPYKVTSTDSYDSIIQYFKEGGIDIYSVIRDTNGNPVRDNKDKLTYINRNLFFNVSPEEQFFISTGSRLFKGIEEYKDLNRMTFDIETRGLRPEIARMFSIGVKDTKGLNIILETNDPDSDEEERKLIIDFFNLIVLKKPAVISGYNSEEFDFIYILKRAEILGIDLKELQTTLSKTKVIQKKRGTVKFGNTTENYRKTIMWGISVLDIQHATKKTAAVNTEIKRTGLKYITKFEGLAKPNRMYIDGNDGGIGKMWDDNKIHIINSDNNKYKEIPKEFQEAGEDFILIQQKKQTLSEEKYKQFRKYLLDNNSDFVKWLRTETPKLLDEEKKGQIIFIEGKDILREYLLDDLWETEQVDNLYNQSSFLLAKIVPTTYSRVATMGNAAVWNLLMTTWSYENDLAVPYADEREKFSGGLARCYKKGWTKRVAKIDFASLYPMLQLWLDIFPMFDVTGVIKKMLLYMTTTRNIYKKLASNSPLKDAEVELMKEIDHDAYEKYIGVGFTKSERAMFKVKQLPIKILNNSLFGALGSAFSFNWSDNICAARITCSGRLALRQAISWFKDFGLEPLLAVTDGINFGIPEKTTIKITDEETIYNQPEDYIENMWQYGGEVGLGAIINKFNSEEMHSDFMSVDNDGEFKACLNLSRINYALLTDSDKIKLTGNTIKSKTMPEYIEEFVDEAMRMILEGRGIDFVNYYHDYSEKIFYRQIPLKKIASKSKFKTTIKDYLNRGTDKNGRGKAKQAHMELVINDREKIAREVFEEKYNDIIEYNIDILKSKDKTKEEGEISDKINKSIESLKEKNIADFTIEEIFDLADAFLPPPPALDSMVYYVNNGARKSHGDVKTIKIKDEKGKVIDEKVTINATLINTEDLENNPELIGEYNVDKYLDAFNKRAEVLLDGFNEEIRQDILVSIKRKKVKDASGKKIEEITLEKNEFTSSDLELKNFDHDKYATSMYLEEKELEFWNRTGYNPKYIWDGFSENPNDLTPQIYDFVLNYLSNKMEEKGKSRLKSINDNINKGDYVLIKNFNKYSIGYHNGDFIEIINPDVQNIPESPEEKVIRIEKDKFENETLEKLKEGIDVTISDELRERLLIKEEINVLFVEFKDQYGLDLSISQKQLFDAEPNAKIAFDDFVEAKKPKEPNEEYMYYEND
jgi:DNA polymerase elongation subunit (family B)